MTDDDKNRMDELERHAREAIADIQRQYEAAAKPYVEILMRIHAMRPAPRVVITLEMYEAMQKARATEPKEQA